LSSIIQDKVTGWREGELGAFSVNGVFAVRHPHDCGVVVGTSLCEAYGEGVGVCTNGNEASGENAVWGENNVLRFLYREG